MAKDSVNSSLQAPSYEPAPITSTAVEGQGEKVNINGISRWLRLGVFSPFLLAACDDVKENFFPSNTTSPTATSTATPTAVPTVKPLPVASEEETMNALKSSIYWQHVPAVIFVEENPDKGEPKVFSLPNLEKISPELRGSKEEGTMFWTWKNGKDPSNPETVAFQGFRSSLLRNTTHDTVCVPFSSLLNGKSPTIKGEILKGASLCRTSELPVTLAQSAPPVVEDVVRIAEEICKENKEPKHDTEVLRRLRGLCGTYKQAQQKTQSKPQGDHQAAQKIAFYVHLTKSPNWIEQERKIIQQGIDMDAVLNIGEAEAAKGPVNQSTVNTIVDRTMANYLNTLLQGKK